MRSFYKLTDIIYTKAVSNNTLLQIRHLLLQHRLKAKWLERNTITLEMLTHRLDPVQSQTVQHGTRTLHDHKNSNGEHEPEVE